jgi:hypothetical protein
MSLASGGAGGEHHRLDDFTDLSGWSASTSGHAQLHISGDRERRGHAMRLDFDFKGGGGFVVARKRFALTLPEVYAFTFDVRGMGPANTFEFKLVDPGGWNVWRYREDAFECSADWRSLRIRSSQIDFAWGPAGSGPAHQVGAIEVAIVARPGGKGTMWNGLRDGLGWRASAHRAPSPSTCTRTRLGWPTRG